VNLRACPTRRITLPSMPVSVPITLQCDQCEASCSATAPLFGKTESKLRVDLDNAKLPEGWSAKLVNMASSYANNPDFELRCGCPAHAENLRKRW
jgi:hypothetical protein